MQAAGHGLSLHGVMQTARAEPTENGVCHAVQQDVAIRVRFAALGVRNVLAPYDEGQAIS